MLTHRVIATLLIKNGTLVKGRQFACDRVVGSPIQALKVFEMRQADELVVLDVAATERGRGPDFEFVRLICDEAMMPLAIGGGVRIEEDFRGLLNAGADKVVVGRAAIKNPGLISVAATIFGSNAVVVSADFSANGENMEDFIARLRNYENLGAGEILLQSIDRDGMMGGYDLILIETASRTLRIPVVASSGAGSYENMALAIQAGADAVAAGALWQFTDATPLGAKKYLKSKGINVRL